MKVTLTRINGSYMAQFEGERVGWAATLRGKIKALPDKIEGCCERFSNNFETFYKLITNGDSYEFNLLFPFYHPEER